MTGHRALSLWTAFLGITLCTAAQVRADGSQARILVTITGKLETLTPEKVAVQIEGGPCPVTNLSSAGSSPVQFVLLLDTSGSNRDKAKFMIDNGLDLYRELVTAGYFGFFGDFDNELYLDPKTSDVKAADKESKQIRFGGGSSIYDSVLHAAKFLQKHAAHPDSPLEIFVISDGEDRDSKSKPDSVIQELQEQGIVVHTVTLLTEHSDKKAIQHFLRLSAKTGGATEVLGGPKKFIPELLQALRQQYWLTVSSSLPTDANLHPVHFATTEPALKIHGPSQITLH